MSTLHDRRADSPTAQDRAASDACTPPVHGHARATCESSSCPPDIRFPRRHRHAARHQHGHALECQPAAASPQRPARAARWTWPGAAAAPSTPPSAPRSAYWGFGAKAGDQRVPDAAAVRQARAAGDWRRLRVDDRGRWHQPGGLRLDLSAIAKGYGVDLAIAVLQAHGVDSALVEVGGDLYGYGRKPDGQAWRVMIEAAAQQDPRSGVPSCTLAVDGLAVATSGDHWHHFEQDGRRYGHLLDPRNGQPIAATLAAVTVVAAETMRADAWATALSVLGADAGLACAEREGLAARFVLRHHGGLQERVSSAFAALPAA
ncbi:FAD:protein FMN transferase [Xanthomonas sacchari]|uniref:FAD:protein FMN transferase n=1 Tax=Xanthomonas sacchari TaxID=56458 RepID=UPI001FC96978|nr:FAD:protein FMN transferase [Xanthomonas sacchari]